MNNIVLDLSGSYQPLNTNLTNISSNIWPGSISITTLGTITTGTWHGSPIADSYIASASTWNAKEPTIISGTTSQYWRGDKTWQTLDKTSVGLSNVENTALSTWSGSTNITTLGTISSGVWQGTAIADSYIASATTWNAKLSANQTITLSGDVTGSGATAITTTLANVVTAGTGTKITYNAKGLITGSTTLTVSDMPSQVVSWPVIVPFVGKPGNNQLFTLVYFTQSVLFPSGLTGSGGVVLSANPASTYTATIYKNASSVGTISISTGGLYTFTFTSSVTYAAGDIMKIIGQATADTTLQDLSFTLVGTAQ